MSENQPKQSRLGPVAGVGRRIQVAGVVMAALVVGLGYGYAQPAASAPSVNTAQSATTSPVNSAEVVCPIVKDTADTFITTFTPGSVTGSGAASSAASETVAQLSALQSTSGKVATILTAGKPGTLAGAQGVNGGSLTGDDVSDPVVARVTGADAPGFTMTESLASSGTTSDAGVASENCGSPDTDFWFMGMGTDKNPFALLNLVNADSIPASVTVTVYTANGPLTGNSVVALQGLTLTSGAQIPELINTVVDGQGAPWAVHVVATVGRVSAAVLDYDGNGGGRDFIGAQKAAGTLVMPGIPQAEDHEQIQLSLLSPDAPSSVTLRWVGQSTITPATTPNLPLELDQGKVTTLDLSAIATQGEYAALEVCNATSGMDQCLPVTGDSGPTDILGEVKVTQSDSSGQDTAYITPVSALTGDGIVADNPSNSVLTLTNTGSGPAQVKVTQTGNGANPTVLDNLVNVPAGQTVGQVLTMPKGANDYALTVTPVSGTVYAARIGGIGHQLSIQPLSTAAETVTIPAVGQDLSGLVPQN